ncbi:pectin lyase fold/virulence factor [Aspergillus desertorum]
MSFIGTEGTTTKQCCSTRTTTCEGGTSAGQASIVDTCDDGTWVSCTYDNAGPSPLDVGSNKSIVGVGSAGVIRGKGLRIRGGASNVIIQNIHLTDTNPQYVWGGDLITLDECDRVWIDHNKFSLAGRQFIVSGWGAAGHVTISDDEFDGVTNWSSGCNGKHYWTLLLIGLEDWYTFRATGRIFFHGVNNYFQNVGGHAFDIDANTWALLEGNYFDANVPTADPASACVADFGYICEWNRLSGSGNWPSLTDQEVLTQFAQYTDSLVDTYAVADVPSTVVANAGVVKI